MGKLRAASRAHHVARVWAVVLVAAVTLSVAVILSLSDLLPTNIFVGVGVAAVSAASWLLLQRFGRSVSVATTPPERLAEVVGATLRLSYLQPWLRATILNPRAVAEYWHCDRSLRLDEISCTTRISGLDARLSVRLVGRNDSNASVSSCPMLMFGGSVLHYADIPENHAVMTTPGKVLTSLPCRSRLDTGQFQLIDMVFPWPMPPGAEFEIQQEHVWPTGMADGEDTLWYPYATLFAGSTKAVDITVIFDRPVRYVTAVEARLNPASCTTSPSQPVDLSGARRQFQWKVERVDNEVIYGLAFEREQVE